MSPRYFEDLSRWISDKARSRFVRRRFARFFVNVVVSIAVTVHPKTTNLFGQGSLLISVLPVLIPVFLPTTINILLLIAILFGESLAWALYCLCGALVVAARNGKLLARQNQALATMIDPDGDAALQVLEIIASGHYLDPGSSAVYVSFLTISTFLAFLLVGYRAELALLLFFIPMILDFMGAFLPLVPQASYMAPSMFIIPTGFFAAISIGTSLLIFPESYSQTWVVAAREEFIEPIVEFLDQNRPEGLSKRSIAQLDGAVLFQEQLQGSLDLELSVHRLSPDQVRGLFKHVKQLVYSIKNFNDAQNRAKRELTSDSNVVDEGKYTQSPPSHKFANSHDYQRLQYISDGMTSVCQISLIDISEWLEDCANDSWSDVFGSVDRRKAEFRRWKLSMSMSSVTKVQTAFMQKSLTDFVDSLRKQEPKRKDSYDSGRKIAGNSLQLHEPEKASCFWNEREIAVALALVDNVNLLATEVLAFLSFLLKIEEHDPKPKFRFPPCITSLFSSAEPTILMPAAESKNLIASEYGSPQPLISPPLPLVNAIAKTDEFPIMTTRPLHRKMLRSSVKSLRQLFVSDALLENASSSKGPRRPQESLAPSESTPAEREPLSGLGGGSSSLQAAVTRRTINHASLVTLSSPQALRFGKLGALITWLRAPETLYAFRMAALTLGMVLPLIFKKTTALFSSHLIGTFALLLGQTYVATYAGDQVLAILVRAAGTILGLLVVPAVWYGSAGTGAGNPYAFVGLTTLFLLPSMFVGVSTMDRNAMTFSIMYASTLVAQSIQIWTQLNVVSIGLPPSTVVLWALWPRALADAIAIGCSLVVMMLPAPTTSRRAFDEKCSESLLQMGVLLKNGWTTVSTWENMDASAWHQMRKELLKSITDKSILQRHFLTTMKFDPRIRSIPSPFYREMFTLQMRLLSGMISYLETVERLNPVFRARLLDKSPHLSHGMVAKVEDCIAFVSESFAGSKIEVPPCSLRMYQAELKQWSSQNVVESTNDAYVVDEEEESEMFGLPVDATDAEILAFSSVIVGLDSIIQSLDEMVNVVRKSARKSTLNQRHATISSDDDQVYRRVSV